jgi:lysophospholipase L1-like esterase
VNIIKPFWIDNEMDSESMFFVQKDENELPSDMLLFTPEEIISVKSASGEIIYEEDKDYVLTSDRTLSLPKGSSIPFKTNVEMHPAPGSPQSISACRDGKSDLFFGEGHFFHDLQTVVTYTHKDKWESSVPQFALDNLPKLMKKLKDREPLKAVLFGDSISAGGNASGANGAKPFMPMFGDLVVNELRRVYGSEITYKNHSIGGTASGWGLENIAVVADEKPDLAILAFGMNDASGRVSPAQFKANIQRQIDAVRQAQPDAEFILVATMAANPEWTASAPELYPQYRDELNTLCKDGAILANVTSIWIEIMKRKSFASITGNGVNHPNDFGHRIYAQVILSLLINQIY